MANRILKSLAIAAGAGVALGFSAGLGRQRKKPADVAPQTPSDAEMRLDDQQRELAALRAEVDASGRRAAGEFASFERRLATTRAELPAAVEAAVSQRVEDLRTRLHAEMEEKTRSGLAQIDQAIDEKLAGRIAALETTLADQSAAIGSLNRRAMETDASLQKLISSVERLCDRAGAPPVSQPVAEPSFFDLPFQAQYDEALRREPDVTPRLFASIK